MLADRAIKVVALSTFGIPAFLLSATMLAFTVGGIRVLRRRGDEARVLPIAYVAALVFTTMTVISAAQLFTRT